MVSKRKELSRPKRSHPSGWDLFFYYFSLYVAITPLKKGGNDGNHRPYICAVRCEQLLLQ